MNSAASATTVKASIPASFRATGLRAFAFALALVIFSWGLVSVWSLSYAQAPARNGAANSMGAAPACSPDWQIVLSPNATGNNSLYSIAAVSSSDVWAVGVYYNGSANQTLVEHWDGTSWNIVPSPNEGSGDNYLNSVAAVSTNDVWAVGNYSNGTVDQTLVEQWDGATWSIVPSPNQGTYDNYLYSVAVVSSTDVWAVGYYSDGTVDQTLVEQWDGVTWNIVPSPNVVPGTNHLYSVAVVSPTDVWAVGYYSNGPSGDATLVERWDGATWNIVLSLDQGASSDLNSVGAVSSTDVWAVGDYLNGSVEQTLIEQWDGATWHIVPSPNQGANANVLNSVSVVSSTDVWAVGAYLNAGFVWQTLIERWNGSQWNIVTSLDQGSGTNNLTSVAAVSSTDVWTVGNYNNGVAYQTLVERYNPCSPSPTPTATPPGTCTITFSDVLPGSTFYPYVHCLACLGIISGYNDGTYRPGNNVTRGQLSKIVSNAAGFSEIHTTQDFTDVPPSDPFFQFIERLYSRGVISGYQCGTTPQEPCDALHRPYFREGNNATRGQISKIVVNTAVQVLSWILLNPPSNTFQDVLPGSAFYQFVETAYAHGVLSGYQCGSPPAGACVPPQNKPYFLPGNNATRGQTAKIVANTFFPNCQVRVSKK